MTITKHLLLSFPDDLSRDECGNFFENFVAGLLRPMRLKVVQRLRFTGMEIDLLARGEDQPRTILVECKAHRDPLAADVISKLLGNVEIRNAEAGWLFSTSDLTKDGRGQWEAIQDNPRLVKKFTWYHPEKIIDILVSQRATVDCSSLNHRLTPYVVDDWTLIVSPSRIVWLAQIIEDGLPTKFTAFDGPTGKPLDLAESSTIPKILPRFEALSYFSLSAPSPVEAEARTIRGPVAPVISGDAWDDLRPARPTDFVGRDDVITDISHFIDSVRMEETSTRTFAVQAPSGMGKSSLVLKLSDLARRNKISQCSFTAVDTRSATNSAFVCEAIRAAFLDAQKRKLLPPDMECRVGSLRDPLDSPDLERALKLIKDKGWTIVLVFDQFEELFAKEDLFETFNAVKDLSLDIDARQIPFILGFAWKTDVSLPQQHPAYHLWHELSDRRKPFKVREFAKRDIVQIITKAEKSIKKSLSPAVRGRLLEQCQGLPWLLKKLLVHVLKRVPTVESQYLLLERELDVEHLFKEDLSVLGAEMQRCLKYVATRAPIAVSEVEEHFSRDTTNFLINSHLLVRSGMNYVIYWDIFRDYLVDGRVPYIPWARTFQRGPTFAIKALHTLAEIAPVTSAELAPALGLKERPCVNLLGDLVALQLVDRVEGDLYKPAAHLRTLEPLNIAQHVQGQFRRHVVVREMTGRLERGRPFTLETWDDLFSTAQPGTSNFSPRTVRQYAMTLRSWLLFAGLLQETGRQYLRPSGNVAALGILKPRNAGHGSFLGTATPKALSQLLMILNKSNEYIPRYELESKGFRNAVVDAFALKLIVGTTQTGVRLSETVTNEAVLIQNAKRAVLKQRTIQLISSLMATGHTDWSLAGEQVRQSLGANWKATSTTRYIGGLRRYYRWANQSGSRRKH